MTLGPWLLKKSADEKSRRLQEDLGGRRMLVGQSAHQNGDGEWFS